MGSMNKKEKIEYNKMLKETSRPLSSHAVLGEVADVVERYMERHNKFCKAGFEIPDCDRLVIKSLLMDFYSRIKDGNFA